MDIKLVGFKPDGSKFEIPITNASAVLGRGEDADVRLPINSVSRKHCEISIEGDHVRIRDLGSANGTFVNNNRVSEVRLSVGDRIVLGPLVMTLQIDGEPADITPPEVVQPVPAAAPAVKDIVLDEADMATEAVSLDAAPISLSGPAPGDSPLVDDEGPISLADDSLADDSLEADPFADLASAEAGESASTADVFGESIDDEIDPISALEMLAGDDEEEESLAQPEQPEQPEQEA